MSPKFNIYEPRNVSSEESAEPVLGRSWNTLAVVLSPLGGLESNCGDEGGVFALRGEICPPGELHSL